MTRAAFLDRDGVINRAFVRGGRPYAPRTVEEFELLPGVTEAVGALRAAGFLVVVVTNQPDVATGLQRREDVDAMHERIRREVGVDDIRVCFHVDADACACRKPKPGMLLDAAADWGVDLAHSFMIGDRWRDVHAGHAAGCRAIFIDYGYDERRPDPPFELAGTLLEASELVLYNRQLPPPARR